MRHHQKNRILGRTRKQRTALLRSLAVSLIEHGRIKTTEAKAKELRPYIEHLVTFGKEGTIAARRKVSTRLGEPKPEVVSKLFGEIAKEYTERNGGYTRILKVGTTQAGRNEAIIEFV